MASRASTPAITSDTRETVKMIQADWENRELVEVIQINMLQITTFLNKFDASARYKLARINEKLYKIERHLDFCEAAVKHALEAE